VLTDRGSEYCGNPERHEYELYLAVEDIDTRAPKPRARRPTVSLSVSTRPYSTSSTVSPSRKKVYRSIDELQADLDLWFANIMSKGRIKDAGALARRRCERSLMQCRSRRRKWSQPNGIGHQNPIAQPGATCQIEFQLIQLIRERHSKLTRLNASQYIRSNMNYASTDHSERTRCAQGNVNDATPPKRAPIIDHHNDTSTAFRIGYSNTSSERQGSMRCRKATWVEPPSISQQAVTRVISG
jgi:hypothetical protein